MCDVNVQGVHFNGQDHIAVEPITIGVEEGVRVTAWNDDPEDWPVGERSAHVWTFLPLAPDPNLGGAINTRQFQLIYAEGERFARLDAALPQNTSLRPYSEFVPPADPLVRHGVWLEDDKWEEHRRSSRSFQGHRDEIGWRHWCDHLPDDECETDGRGRRMLKPQRDRGRWRRASHTITYYQRDDDRATGHLVATNENALELTADTGATESVTTNANAVRGWSFITPTGQPNVADWPSGDYRAQLDCTAASGGLTYGVMTLDGVQSFFYKWHTVNVTHQEEIGPQSQSAFSGTGLKLASVNFNPASAVAENLYEVTVTAFGDSHGDAITLRFSSDAFADGPWSTGFTTTIDSDLDEVSASLNAVMFPSVTVDSDIDETRASLNAIQPTTGTIVSLLDELTASLNAYMAASPRIQSTLDEVQASLAANQIYTAEVDGLLDELTASLNAAQSYPVNIVSLLDEIQASLNAYMRPDATIDSDIDEVSASLNVDQAAPDNTDVTVAALTDEVQAALALAQQYLQTIATELSEVAFSGTAVMLPTGTVQSTLDEVLAALSVLQSYPLTVTSTLDEVTISLNVNQSHLMTIDADLDELLDSLSVVMEAGPNIVSTLDEIVASLSAGQSHLLVVDADLDEVVASLNATASGDASVTIGAALDEIAASLNANQAYLMTINVGLDEVSIDLEAIYLEAISLTIATNLEELVFSLAGVIVPFVMNGQPKWLYIPNSRLAHGPAPEIISTDSRMPRGPVPRVTQGKSRQ